MIWTILGIEQTKDKKTITRAYREKLAAVNPEEKPEEFKQLRSAYEQALSLADQEEKPREEKSAVELWTDELAALYDDLPSRLNVEAWRELLSRNICQALDSRPDVEEALLRFLMERYYISHEVMQYLNACFGWADRMEELAEKYPKDFLTYVIQDKLQYEDSLRFSMFQPGLNGKMADEYYRLYQSARRTPAEEAEEIYEKMRACPEQHPYGQAFLWQMELYQGNEEALGELVRLHEHWNEDNLLSVVLMRAYKNADNWEKAEPIARQILDRDPKNTDARRFLAEFEAHKGDYKQAVHLINRLMHDNFSDTRMQRELEPMRHEWNEKQKESLQKTLSEDPSDDQTRFDLIWCYLEDNDFEAAKAMADDLSFEQPDAFGYYNMHATIANALQDYERASRMEEQLLAVTQALVPDGTEKTAERIARKTEVMARLSNSYHALGRTEEAISLAEQSVAEDPENRKLLLNLAGLYLQQKDYGKTIEAADRYIRMEPREAYGYYLKADACFMTRQDNIAFDAIDMAIDRDGSVLEYYLLKLQILSRNRAFEPANELIDFLKENGITEDITIDWCKIQIYSETHANERADRETLEGILREAAQLDARLAEGTYGKPRWAGDFYHTYAGLTADRQNLEKKYPVEPLIEILDKGIAMDPDHYDCLCYKGWLLKKMEKDAEALEIFLKLEKVPRYNLYVERQLAELYYNDLRNNAEKSLGYYDMLIEEYPEDGSLRFYAGMCNLRLDRFEEAQKHFLKEQELDPEDIDGYYRLAYTYQKMNRLEDSLVQAEKTVEMAREREGDTSHLWMPLIRCYRRMGKTEEAIEAILDCAAHNPDWNPHSEIVDIYLQLGMFTQAEKQIRQWIRSGKDRKGWVEAKAQLYHLQKKAGMLAWHVFDYKVDMGAAATRSAKEYAALRKGNLKKYEKIMREAFEKMNKDGEYSVNIHSDYAWSLWLNGKHDEAKQEAEKILAKLDVDCRKAVSDRLLFQSKRIPVLAILGREQEVREQLRVLRAAPLCEMCDCCRCKDLDEFELMAEIIFGNYDRCRQIIDACRTQWPAEYAYIDYEYLLPKEGK